MIFGLPTLLKTAFKPSKTGIHFVFSSYRRSNENLEFVYSDFIVPNKVTYTDILKTNSISCLTAFIDIEVLGKKTMPEIFKRQDMGLWLKYLKEIPLHMAFLNLKPFTELGRILYPETNLIY